MKILISLVILSLIINELIIHQNFIKDFKIEYYAIPSLQYLDVQTKNCHRSSTLLKCWNLLGVTILRIKKNVVNLKMRKNSKVCFCLVWFYSISTIVGYLMSTSFLYLQTVLFQTIQLSIRIGVFFLFTHI